MPTRTVALLVVAAVGLRGGPGAAADGGSCTSGAAGAAGDGTESCSSPGAAAAPNAKVLLSPGEVHVVDGFLSPEEVASASASLDATAARGRLEPAEFAGTAALECPIGGDGGPIAAQKGCVDAEDAVGTPLDALAARVVAYATENLQLNSNLSGSYAFTGSLHHDHSVLRRYPTQRVLKGPEGERVVGNEGHLHVDTDFEGRCLSAVVFLTTSDDGGTSVFACPSGEEHRCEGLQGDRLMHSMKEGFYSNRSRMVLKKTVSPASGRAVFFLSNTVHAVAPLASRSRDALLVWMSCRPLGEMDIITRNVKVPWLPFSAWASNAGTVDAVRQSLQKGSLVRVTSAMRAGITEALFHDLANAPLWEHELAVTEKEQFSRHSLRCDPNDWRPSGCSELLGKFHRHMSAQLPFFANLAGMALDSWLLPEGSAATWYRKGDFESPKSFAQRGCAFVVALSLAIGWQPEHGGALWWMRSTGADSFVPAFNTLYMLRVNEISYHTVSPVVSESGQHIVISGCFSARGPKGT